MLEHMRSYIRESRRRTGGTRRGICVCVAARAAAPLLMRQPKG